MKTIHTIIIATAIVLISHPVTPENPKEPLPFHEWQSRVAAHIANLNARVAALEGNLSKIRWDISTAQDDIKACGNEFARLAKIRPQTRAVFIPLAAPPPQSVDTSGIEQQLRQLSIEIDLMKRGW